MKMSQKTKSSTGAFFNASSGVEWALNQIANTDNPDDTTVQSKFALAADGSKACPFGSCDVYFLKADGTVITRAQASGLYVSDIEAVRSVGTQGGETQRAIEAATAAGGGWVDDGAIVRLTTPDDQVGIGTINPNADVKLEVNGAIRTVPRSGTPALCDASTQGSIYYDSSGSDSFFGCIGNTWKQFVLN